MSDIPNDDLVDALKEPILAVIRDAMPAGISARGICDAYDGLDSTETALRCLKVMQAEKLVSVDGARWKLRQRGGSAASDTPPRPTRPKRRTTARRASKPKRTKSPRRPAVRRPPKAKSTDLAVRETLEQGLAHAQASLDAYICSVCDTATFHALRDARDAARRALATLGQ